jgi:hypothetical protein
MADLILAAQALHHMALALGVVDAYQANRDTAEARLQEALTRLGEMHLRLIMKALGDPPRLENISAAAWRTLFDDLNGTIVPLLQDEYLAAAEAFLAESPIGVDWGLVNKNAANWARIYTYDLVKGITNTTQDALREKVAGFFQNQMTLGQLRESIAPLFGDTRAISIARTEVTRAAVEGENSVVNLIELETGLEMEPIFQTSRDDKVCPKCGPLDNKVVLSEDFPPLHVGCRCGLSHRFKR